MAVFIAVLVATSCELSEVVVPTGSDLLVVEAVLRGGSRQQSIILHRSMEGRVVRGEADASVVVVTEDRARIRYEPVDILACLLNDPEDWEVEAIDLEASCYLSPREAGRFVQPGG
ncbi:MAG TPA: hypothetical protein VM534_10755, partial [Thermoanaerobaculia bacterium]|nr:hypothetical protein [Thermoanaerobaculia bacterium]